MKETRRLKRRHLIYYLRVFEKKTGKLLGHIADLTIEGLMLVGEKPVKENKPLSLKMQLPQKIEGSSEVAFSAVCIWCRKDVNPDFYGSGLQLLDVSPKVVDIIESMTKRLAFRD